MKKDRTVVLKTGLSGNFQLVVMEVRRRKVYKKVSFADSGEFQKKESETYEMQTYVTDEDKNIWTMTGEKWREDEE